MLQRLREPKVFNVSGFDTIGTLVLAYLAALLFKWDLGLTIIIFFILAEVAHCAFKIDTPISRQLCPSSITPGKTTV